MSIDQLRFRKTGSSVVLEGTAQPGTTIKAENVSAAPMSATWHADGFTETKANAKGQFSLEVPAAVEGDKVKVSSSDGLWQVLTVQAGGTDNRRAEFNPQGFRLVEQAPGTYVLATVSVDSVACEPGTVVQMFNMRTQQGLRFKLDAEGRFPATFNVQGEPGDVFALASSDGVNNADFSAPCGFLVVPPRRAPGDTAPLEPGLLPGDSGKLAPWQGPLFVDGAQPTDAVQGEDLGDCYLVSTAAALAQACPEKLQQLIHDNGDGTYTVDFKRYDAEQQAYVSDKVTVSNALPTDDQGLPRYGHSSGATPGKMELWFPVLEKAYAAWKGGYTGIINGFPYEVFEACLGKAGQHFDVRSMAPDQLFASLSKSLQDKQPVVAWTGVDSTEHPFAGTTLAPDHAYAVLAVSTEGAERFVTVRNPYGHQQPAAGAGDDGVSRVPWKTFLSQYVGAGTVAP